MLQIRNDVNNIVNGGLRKHFDPRIIINKIDSLLIVVEYQFVIEYLCIHKMNPSNMEESVRRVSPGFT